MNKELHCHYHECTEAQSRDYDLAWHLPGINPDLALTNTTIATTAKAKIIMNNESFVSSQSLTGMFLCFNVVPWK